MKIKDEKIRDVIIPYLQNHWDEIDSVQLPKSPDGRLVREKIFLKYLEALTSGRIEEALTLEAIFERFDEICACYEDAYVQTEESIVGMSEEDVSVYIQKLAGVEPPKRRPRPWRRPTYELDELSASA
ncbi:MAG: hypothetical protein K2X93_00365 [Candidatus Obscuribacterales bacterium]|nr:hypothetical protein [Candidatus Obscuribacterales bacterium]